MRQAQYQSTLFNHQEDPAFYGRYSLLTTDQGIRGLLYVANDTCYIQANELKLSSWTLDGEAEASDEHAIHDAIGSLARQPAADFLKEIAKALSKYDWRTSSAPDLSEPEQLKKAALRGSGGYKELRRDLLRHLAREGKDVGTAAKNVASALRYDI